MGTVTINRRDLELGQVPAICFVCAASPARRAAISLPYTPTGGRIFVSPKENPEVIVGMMHAAPVGVIAAPAAMIRNLLVTRRISLELPLCERHHQAVSQHPRLRILALFLGLLGFGLMVPGTVALVRAIRGGINPMEKFGFYWVYIGIAFACLIVALFIRARLHDGFLYVESIDEEEIVLGGVSPELAQQIAR